jgi:hypothetical protein
VTDCIIILFYYTSFYITVPATLRWAGHVTPMAEKRNAYRLLVGKPEGRRPLGRPRRRWVDYVRMDLVEVGWGDVDGIGLVQNRDRWRAGKVSSVQTTRDLSSRAHLHGVSSCNIFGPEKFSYRERFPV